ncbi:MAG: hypothetical protein V2I54_09195 [Bacteroidales bacterium]|jgi:hypothetical protein|nr:hypothetical protein [Bacteroidales bacterium]
MNKNIGRNMNHRILIILIFQIFLHHLTTHSQETIDSIYGLDPVLYNGKVYSYRTPPSVQGSQYLTQREFVPGEVIIQDKTYTHHLLNYDIFNQEILLQFETDYKTATIQLNKEKVDAFTLDSRTFKLIQNEEKNTYEIFQFFGRGKYVVLYFWEKNLELIDRSGDSYWSFSKPQKTMYLQFNNEKHRFRNNRTFLTHFTKSQKQEIKTYLKQNKLNLKRITDTELNQIIHFCNQLKF